MKKLHISLASLCLILLIAMFASSCGAPGVDKPTGLYLDTDTLTLSWDKVPGATGYTVTAGDKVKTTKANRFSLESLEPGEYRIEIVAEGNGVDSGRSAPAVFEFKREQESGLTYELINNNTEYQLKNGGSAEGDVVMESVFRGKPVTSIAPSALANNSAITSFVIADSITDIPKKAFYNCSALVSVVIPESVSSVGENAFQSCKSLESVVLPGSITKVSDYCFSYCRALKSFSVGSAVTEIGAYAFSDCNMLEAIALPDSVVTLGEGAFSNCESAKTLKMSASIESIGAHAFRSCGLITDVSFGEKLEHIGESAFESCFGLTDVTLPDSLISIGTRAFSFCEALDKVIMSGVNVESIGRQAFQDTAFLDKQTEDIVYLGSWVLLCTNQDIAEESDIILDDSITVTGIADYAFAGCGKFTGITLKDVKYIGNNAFYNCENMMQIKLGESALRIGDAAFALNKNLTSVLIKDTSLTYIGDYAFKDCGLSKISLPDTVETIGTFAFNGTKLAQDTYGVVYADKWAVDISSTAISNIEIKDGTVGIADYTFFGCKNIQQVSMPDTLQYIGRGSFLTCTLIFIPEFPAELKRIEDYAFYGCRYSIFGEDYNLVLPEGLEYIGRSAFYQTSMCGISIPGSCKYIGDYAFYDCFLTWRAEVEDESFWDEIPLSYELVLGEGIEYIGSRAFYACTEIKTVSLPNSLKEMGIRAFYKCMGLEEVSVGIGLKEIPSHAFYGCESLKSVSISGGTETVGNSAFRGCTSLVSVQLGNGVRTIGDYAFRGCEALEGLSIPASVTCIGDFALRGNLAATSVILKNTLTDVGQHAVYGNSKLTVYTEFSEISEFWNGSWNSSFRPVVLGCTLSGDGSYVVSFEKNANSILNSDAVNGISAPHRDGYIFAGWATEAGGEAEYSAENITEAPDGTVLYTVWLESQITE